MSLFTDSLSVIIGSWGPVCHSGQLVWWVFLGHILLLTDRLLLLPIGFASARQLYDIAALSCINLWLCCFKPCRRLM